VSEGSEEEMDLSRKHNQTTLIFDSVLTKDGLADLKAKLELLLNIY
jgi:hypothetical protein